MSNAYHYDELNVGAEFYSPTRTITESDIIQFAGLTGDLNELHTSATFAKNTSFGERIAHGMPFHGKWPIYAFRYIQHVCFPGD